MECDSIASPRCSLGAHDARRRFRLHRHRCGRIKGERNPNACLQFARLGAVNEQTFAGGVERLRDFQAHAEWAAPSDSHRELELGSGMPPDFGVRCQA